MPHCKRIGSNQARAEQWWAILLAVYGPTTYQLIGSLASPAKSSQKMYKEIIKLVQDHQQPTLWFIVQRFNFHDKVQRPEESVSDFVAQLRKLFEHCRFGDQLEEMLLNRLVCGCLEKLLQGTLLAQQQLTFDKAFKWLVQWKLWSKKSRICTRIHPSLCMLFIQQGKNSYPTINVMETIGPQAANSRLLLVTAVISKATFPLFAVSRFGIQRKRNLHWLNPHVSFKQRMTHKLLNMQCIIHLPVTLSPSWSQTVWMMLTIPWRWTPELHFRLWVKQRITHFGPTNLQ